MKEFIREDLEFYLPKSFKGLDKKYILDCIFNDKIQSSWKPKVGDLIVGCTGNIFSVSARHQTSASLGGDKFFFGGGLCNRDGGILLDSTFSSIMNKDGLEYFYGDKGIEKRENYNYSKISDFRYLPYPHELNTDRWNILQNILHKWTVEKFGNETNPLPSLNHLKGEVLELIEKPNDRLEWADCFIILIHAAKKQGYSMNDIYSFIQEKHEINKTRKWSEPNEKGVCYHI